MKINLKLRFKNKTTLLAMLACAVAFVYQMLGIMGIAAPISEDLVMQFVGAGLNILVGVGILVDPTTTGVGDSKKALMYKEPN